MLVLRAFFFRHYTWAIFDNIDLLIIFNSFKIAPETGLKMFSFDYAKKMIAQHPGALSPQVGIITLNMKCVLLSLLPVRPSAQTLVL